MRRRHSLPVEIIRALGLLAAFLVTCLVAGVLAAGFGLPAAAAAGFLTNSGYDYYNDLPEDLEVPPLSERSTILAADGSVIAYLFFQNRFVVPLANVSPIMVDAVISIEDQRFYEHNGVDARGTLRAFVANASDAEGTQGGSTLTQQYVKNVLLEEAVRNNNEEDIDAATASRGIEGYRRKFTEARYALALEQKYTKEEILEKYLNIANFGNSTYGIYAASRTYFQVDPAQLTLPQSALLAGVVQRPSDLDPVTNPEAATARRNVVLTSMLNAGKISQADYDAAVASPLGVTVQEPPNGCKGAGQLAYFCEYAIQEVIGKNLAEGAPSPYAALGATAADRNQALYRGGVTVQTTINPGLQSLAWESVRSKIGENERAGVGLATVDPQNGHILAMAQNRQFGDDADVPDYTVPQFTEVNFSTGGSLGFNPGSNFKPFTLAAWLKAGKPLSAVVDASAPLQASGSDYTASCTELGNPTYRPVFNAGDSPRGSGGVQVIQATSSSINTAYHRMAQQLDLCDIADTAKSLGVTDMAGAPNDHGNFDIVPSMVLGSTQVSPLMMAGAYGAFGREGLFCPPTSILSITSRQGEPIAVTPNPCVQALDPEVAKGVNYALQRTLLRGGTAASLGGIGRPSAGKTGTTNNSKDTWFTGYTPYLSTSVWVGDTQPTPQLLTDFAIAGERRGAVFGSTYALPTWGAFMRAAPAALGQPPDGFADPNENTIYGPRVRVPNVTGVSRSTAERRLTEAGLGSSVSDERRPGPPDVIVSQSPGAGASIRTGDAVTIYLGGGGGGDGRGNGGDDRGGGGDEDTEDNGNGRQP